jgi:hypothetical protein
LSDVAAEILAILFVLTLCERKSFHRQPVRFTRHSERN